MISCISLYISFNDGHNDSIAISILFLIDHLHSCISVDVNDDKSSHTYCNRDLNDDNADADDDDDDDDDDDAIAIDAADIDDDDDDILATNNNTNNLVIS